MKNPIFVSFIIPCLNGEKFIAKCFDSIISQTIPNWEIVVVDNGSTDSSVLILNEYARRDSRIRVFTNKVQCQSTAKNVAIQHARGEYLCFVDIDDYIGSNLIESYPIADGCDFYFSNWYKVRKNKITKRLFPVKDGLLSKDDITNIQRWIFGDVKSKNPLDLDTFSSNCGKLYKTSLVKDNNISFVPMSKIGGSEDAIFNMQYLEYAQSGYFSGNCLYYYVSHNDSYTHKRKIDTLNLYFEQHKIEVDILKKYNKMSNWYKFLCNRLLIVSFAIFIVVARLNYPHKVKIKFLKNFLECKLFSDNVALMNADIFGFIYRILLKLIIRKQVRVVYCFIKIASVIL